MTIHKTIVTHSGGFHTDDILAVAVIELFEGGELSIVRTRDENLISEANYVVDVGREYDPSRGRFDHHQEGGAGARTALDPIPYASCGLVWKEYGSKICNSELVAQIMDDRLFKAVDSLDNGAEIATPIFESVRLPLLMEVVYLQNPTWKESDNTDESFRNLVNFFKEYILRSIKVIKDNLEAEDAVRNAYEEAKDKRMIILERSYPFQEVLARFPEPLFVIYPSDSQEGTWRVKGIRKSRFTFDYRYYLNPEWGGKDSEELEKISGIPGALFVHNHLFTGSAKDKAGAILMVERSLNI